MTLAPAARVSALIEIRRFAEAHALIASLIGESPDDAQLHYLGSLAHLRDGRYMQAVSWAQEALARDPESVHALEVIARAHLESNAYRRSREAARLLLELAPQNLEGHVVCAMASAHLAEHRLEAIQHADLARNMAPYASAGHFAVGYVAHIQGRRKEAVAAYRAALAIDPANTAARSNMAHVTSRWRLVRSARVFASVLADEPGDDFARRSLDLLGRRAIQLVVLVCVGVYFGTRVLTLWTDVYWTHVAGSAAMALLAPASLIALWRQVPTSVRNFVSLRRQQRFRMSLARLGMILLTAEVLLVVPAFPNAFGELLLVLVAGWLAYLVWSKWDEYYGPLDET